MNTIRWFMRQFWDLTSASLGVPISMPRYRITPRENSFAFRRSLLRDVVTRLKRLPLSRTGPRCREDPAGADDHAEQF